MSKKTILHIIDSFGLGGAEKIVLGTINNLQEYNHILVLLNKPDDLVKDITAKNITVFILDHNKYFFLTTINKIKKIIKENSVTLVHAHLYWSTLIARLATRGKLPFFFSLHSIISADVYKNKWYSYYTKLFDKITYKKSQILIGVSSEVVLDYKKHIGVKGKTFVLHNFVDNAFFSDKQIKNNFTGELKLVAVGNLKEAKNYIYLINAFKNLKSLNISLDIYGEGHQREFLQKEIDNNKLRIVLKGKSTNINNILSDYNAYVMCSIHEGFGLAPAEAMVTGLMPILSDIPALREMSFNKGIYININSTKSFVSVVTKILNGEIIVSDLSKELSKLARDNYSSQNYMEKLTGIYKNELNSIQQ